MQRSFCLFIIIGLFIFVSGCIKSDTYTVIYEAKENSQITETVRNQQLTMAVIPKVTDIPYFNAVKEGVEQAAEAIGITVYFNGPSIANHDLQESVVRHYIKQEVDVIAVSVNDPDRLSPVLAKARKQGIKVITWDADASAEARDYFINMVDPETLGRHLLDTLAGFTEEKGEYVILTGAEAAANQREWVKWIKQQNKAYYPEMELVEVVPTDDNALTAYQEAERVVEAYPNLKGILGTASLGPPAAAQVLQEKNKAGDIAVVGLASPSDMNNYLKTNAAQMTTLWSPKQLGYLTVMIGYYLANDILPADGQQIPGAGNVRVFGDTIIMGEPIDITRENVDQYDF